MIEKAFATVEDLQAIIDMVKNTHPDSWQLDVVRSDDGTKNCFFGHLWNWAEANTPEDANPRDWANRVWEAFEERWATTYAIYPINDGKNPDYPQPEARDRITAYLEALRDGRELDTHARMERDYAASITV